MKPLLAFVFAMLVSPTALGQHQTLTVDPKASEVRMTLHTTHEVVNGTFHVQAGSVDFDPVASRISGIVEVAAGSGGTGNTLRDKKMNGILKADQFTRISFEPRSYTGKIAALGDSSIQVSGVFKLLGVSHDLTIPTQVHRDGSGVTAKAQFVVPYVEWGLKNPSFLVWKADNDVSIDLSLVGQVDQK